MWGVWRGGTVKKSQWSISVERLAETRGKCAPHIHLACTSAEIQGNFRKGLITSPPPMPEIPEHGVCRDQGVQLPLLHTAPCGTAIARGSWDPHPSDQCQCASNSLILVLLLVYLPSNFVCASWWFCFCLYRALWRLQTPASASPPSLPCRYISHTPAHIPTSFLLSPFYLLFLSLKQNLPQL